MENYEAQCQSQANLQNIHNNPSTIHCTSRGMKASQEKTMVVVMKNDHLN